MNQSITNWFTSTTRKSTGNQTKPKKKTACVISTNQSNRKGRKRKRSQTDLDHDDDDDDDDEQSMNNNNNTPFTQCAKRRKLSNTKKKPTNSQKKTAKQQTKNILSFLTPKNKNSSTIPNNNNNNNNNKSDNDVEIIDLITPSMAKKTVSNKANSNINNDNKSQQQQTEEDKENIDISTVNDTDSMSTSNSPQPPSTSTNNDKNDKNDENNDFTTSRYGRKRKKINYSLTSYWGFQEKTESKQSSQSESSNDEEYEIESEANKSDEDDSYNTSDEEFIPQNENSKKTKRKTAGKAKNSKNNKKSSKQKKSKTASLSAEQEKEIAETFFMTKSQKRQYKRDKVMNKFKEEIAKRHSEDQRLFGGKKANPYFEIAKQRQEILDKVRKNKKSKPENITIIQFQVFPKISSVQPQHQQHDIVKEEDFKIKCQDLMQDEFDNEMNKIEEQISDLLYSPVPKYMNNASVTGLTMEDMEKLDFKEGNLCNLDRSLATTPRYTYYWTSQESLNKYCTSSEFVAIISQISREFPRIDHGTIKNELLMCLNRTIDSDLTTHHIICDSRDRDKENDKAMNAMWCDKYKPLKATEVVGNWDQANELKKWLKAWTNAEDKRSYLAGDEYNWIDDENDMEYSDSDDDWRPTTSSDIQLSNTVLLTGPTACGKTASVYAVAVELQYKVIEVNCIRIKTAKDLNDLIGEATQSHQVAKSQKNDKKKKKKKGNVVNNEKNKSRSIVLLEEVDNMLESVPSIVKSITNFMNNSRCPIILTAERIPNVLKNLGLINFQFNYGSLDRLSLRAYIIALSEGVCLTRKEIEKIVSFFDYDLRSVLINLQFWLTSPRTFDHFNIINDNKIPLPSMAIRRSNRNKGDDDNNNNNDNDNDDDDIFSPVLYSLPDIKNKIERMHQLSIYQRIIGYADISFNSCNGKDHLFWSHFVGMNNNNDMNVNQYDLNDNLYCFIQHVLDSNFTDDIIFNSFPFWFVNDINAIRIHPKSSAANSSLAQLFNNNQSKQKQKQKQKPLHCNSNPFKYSWIENPAIVEARNVINSLLHNICDVDDGDNNNNDNEIDIEMKEKEEKKEERKQKEDDVSDNIEWLQDWSIMIDSLSDNDILQKPKGCCLNSTYHDRLHPHTTAIFDEPMDITWEYAKIELYSNPYYLNEDIISNPFTMTNKNNNNKKQSESQEDELCEIYDTIQHEYLKQYISPYLVTLSIIIGAVNKDKMDRKNIKFEPKLIDDLIDKQTSNNADRYTVAESFRRHPIEGNFDFPTTRAWFDYYHEFISTICINEYHRERKGGSQYKNGRAIRRSRRNHSTFFEHVLEGWLNRDQSYQIVEKWKQSFSGMGWKKDSVPTL